MTDLDNTMTPSEWILGRLIEQTDQQVKLNEIVLQKLQEKDEEVKKMKEEIQYLTGYVEGLKERINDLEKQSHEHSKVMGMP